MDLLSEEEQWEGLKRWLRQNVPSILGLVAVVLIGVFAWRWWQSRADQQALEANAAFMQIVQTFDSGKIDEAMAQMEALRSKHPKSAYVTAADLAAAKVFVATNQLDKAVQRLERVMNESPDLDLRPVAQMRLARVFAAQGQFDKALSTLGTADMGRFQPAFVETRGDILLEKGDRAGALREYESARKLLPPDQAGVAGVGELLDLKINDLRAGDAARDTTSAIVPEAAKNP